MSRNENINQHTKDYKIILKQGKYYLDCGFSQGEDKGFKLLFLFMNLPFSNY